jgi:hypothetical protein
MFGIAIAQRNPEAQITSLDWAAVLEVASAHAAKAGIADRFHTLPADSDHELPASLAHAALKPGGIAITLEFVPDEDRVGPPVPARFAMTMPVTTAHGDACTWSEYEAMLRDAGFAENRIQMLESWQSVIISVK